ncbi:MAG: TonB-dependent receptor plug domain-containing protein, partial [Bacteroidales bacterium]|nr:TonB-dependent receptor plug domain-containing protein [Bacteroidales bacterium]
MKRQLQKHNNAFRFKRYCRGAFAVFNSLHREVTIGRVATYIADKQLRKAVAACAVAMMLLPSNEAVAQNEDADDMVTLPEVVVSVSTDTLSTPQPAAVLTKKDFSNTSVRSVGDLLALIPGIDIRSRGINDVQGDISVHGGTFDQMLVLLNGINLTDAQTGHHNLDMPIDISMVERVELLTPSMLLAKGIVSYCGAVNIVVSDAYSEKFMAELGGGSYGTGKCALLGTKLLGRWAATVAASYNRSDGYMRNTDYRHGSLFVQASRHLQNDHWLLQTGGQLKNFGSQAFYSTSYPDQNESTRTLTVSASNTHRFGNGLRLESDIYSRVHADRFELFRDGYAQAPEWYVGHNHHISATSGLRNRLVYKFGSSELTAGTEVRREGILSNVLGENLDTAKTLFGYSYPKASSRLATSL